MASCAVPNLCQFRIASSLPTGRRLRTRRQFRARSRHQPFPRQSRENQQSPGARPTSLMTTSLSSNRRKQARRCKMSRARLAGSGEAAERRQQVAPAKSAAACRVGKGSGSNAGGLFGGRDRTQSEWCAVREQPPIASRNRSRACQIPEVKPFRETQRP